MEIYKLIQKKEVTAYANTFTNLAIGLFTSMEPEPPKVTTSLIKGKEWKWTAWDSIEVNQVGITLSELIAFIKAQYGLHLMMLSSGVSILFSDFMSEKKLKERRNMSVHAIYEMVTKKEISPMTKYLILEVIANDQKDDDDEDGEEEEAKDVDLPYLRLRLF